ncbi:MAG TPA: protein kinase [Vicinamibacterales bacterium]|nr:protein kinase [Vicinamibacterales bacterium]
MRPEVTALFRELADRSPEEREEYYVREGVAEALREEIESLLRYDKADDSIRGYVDSAQREFVDETVSHTREATVRPAPRRGRSALPDLIGRFAITKLLGRGGMGEVYLARDPIIDRMVAIKVIGSGLEDDAGRHRLLREARAAGRLHHSNIVSVFEAGEYENRLFIAMEYVPGETLGSMIRRRAAVTLRRRLEMIESACAGLAHAHRAGVVHLDIKPDNLMLEETGVVKVLDFGISRMLQSETRATGQGAGTLRYMSPEQVQGAPLDHRSDVFSLGCSLFELVTYAPAFSGSTQEIVTQIAVGPVPSLLSVAPELDPRLDQIIRRAMALEPTKRYDDLEVMRAELAQVRAGIDPASDVANASLLASDGGAIITPSQRTSRRGSVWRSRAAIAVGVLVMLVAATLVLVYRDGRVSTDDRSAATPATTSPAPTINEPPIVVEKPAPAPPQDDTARQSARGDRAAIPERPGKNSADAAPPNAVTTSPDRSRAPVEPRAGAAGDLSTTTPNAPPPVVNETPPTPTPPAAAAPPAPAAAATPIAPALEMAPDSAAIMKILSGYDAAYQSLDVGAVLKVFPSLGSGQVEQLRRTFAGVTAYEMKTRVKRVDVKNDTATVLATVSRRMTPRVGDRRPIANEFDTEFQLRRSGGEWIIVSVRAR